MPLLHTKNHHKIILMYIDGSDTFTHLDSISYFNRHKISLDENQNSLPIG